MPTATCFIFPDGYYGLCGAGIGGGAGNIGEAISITGGTVIASGGASWFGYTIPAGIGDGEDAIYNELVSSGITVSDKLSVYAGTTATPSSNSDNEIAHTSEQDIASSFAVKQYAEINPDEYQVIHYADCTNGEVSGPVKVRPDETVTPTVTPAPGYELDTLTVKTVSNNTVVTVTDGSFTMPEEAVTVSATFKIVPHTLTVKYVGAGATTSEVQNLTVGQSYNIETPVKAGYRVDKTVVTGTMGIEDEEIIVTYTKLPDTVKDATYTASLTLGKNIDVNFKMGNIASADTDKLLIIADGKVVDFELKDGVASCVLKAVEPKDIGKDIHVVVIYDGVTVKNFNYSVISYCNAVYNHKDFGADSTLGKLCTAILNYGKYAEDYVNEQALENGEITTLPAKSTVNAGHELDLSTLNLPTSKKIFTPNAAYGDKDSGASLEIGSTIKLNYFVKSSYPYTLVLVKDMENAKAVKDEKYITGQEPYLQNFFILNENKEQIDPARIEVTEATGGYKISVDLYAYQLSKEYTLKVKNVDLKNFEITFGVYDYCVYINENNYSATLKSLCKAIYNYGEAVKAYIG